MALSCSVVVLSPGWIQTYVGCLQCCLLDRLQTYLLVLSPLCWYLCCFWLGYLDGPCCVRDCCTGAAGLCCGWWGHCLCCGHPWFLACPPTWHSLFLLLPASEGWLQLPLWRRGHQTWCEGSTASVGRRVRQSLSLAARS